MVATKTLLTADEFFALPKGEGKQELVRGEVRVTPPVGGQHGDAQLGLGVRMRLHADREGQGFVVTETGFRLFSSPDTVRAPDLAFIAAARFPEGALPRGYIDGPPDIAVEVVSPHDTHSEVLEKVQEYLDAGARLVWVVDPQTRSVTVHHPGGTSRTLRHNEVLTGEDVMPGFQVVIGELFRS